MNFYKALVDHSPSRASGLLINNKSGVCSKWLEELEGVRTNRALANFSFNRICGSLDYVSSNLSCMRTEACLHLTLPQGLPTMMHRSHGRPWDAIR